MKERQLLVVTPYFASHGGGIESVAWQLIQQMLEADMDLRVEWMASDCDPLPPKQARVRFLRARSWNGIEAKTGLPVPVWSARAVVHLWRAIGRSDAVHFHDVAYMSSVLTALFCRVQRRPYLVTQHTGFVDHPNRWMRALRAWINRVPGKWMLERARTVAFISDEVRRAFAPLLPRQSLHFIANGVNTEVFCDTSDEARARERREICDELGFDPARPLLLFVGRFVAMKGILIVVELARRFPDCNWMLAGAGPLEDSLGLPSNARIVRGRRGKTLAPIYRAADLLLLPSYSEGFPLVVQESLSCGTPVLIERKIGDAAPAARARMNLEPLDGCGNDIERWSLKLRALLDEGENAPNAERHARAKWAQEQWNWPRSARAYLDLFFGAGAGQG